ncbi:hypothetical protein ABK040_013508 [Willaertia magna]
MTKDPMEQIYKDEEDNDNKTCLISSISWIPKGCFKLNPTIISDKAPPSENYMSDDDDNTEQSNNTTNTTTNNKSSLGGFEEISIEELLLKSMTSQSNRYYKSNDEDPYLNKKDSDDDEEEEEDFKYKENDLPFLTIQNEEDGLTTLNIWVYEPNEENLFLHHDILLSNYGLCSEWLNLNNNNQSNFSNNCIAIGSFEPYIEIWDLDIIDPINPLLVLGKNKKGNYHEGPILCLSKRKDSIYLASGSEDKSIQLWDLNNNYNSIFRLKNIYTTPINNIQFHNEELNIVLTTSLNDNLIKIFDYRNNNNQSIEFKKNFTNIEIESSIWNNNNPYQFITTQENGNITIYDMRNNNQHLFTYLATNNNKSCTDISIKNNILASVGCDGYLKCWDLNDNYKLLFEKQVVGNNGKLFTCDFCPNLNDNDFIVSYGGDHGVVGTLYLNKEL